MYRNHYYEDDYDEYDDDFDDDYDDEEYYCCDEDYHINHIAQHAPYINNIINLAIELQDQWNIMFPHKQVQIQIDNIHSSNIRVNFLGSGAEELLKLIDSTIYGGKHFGG